MIAVGSKIRLEWLETLNEAIGERKNIRLEGEDRKSLV